MWIPIKSFFHQHHSQHVDLIQMHSVVLHHPIFTSVECRSIEFFRHFSYQLPIEQDLIRNTYTISKKEHFSQRRSLLNKNCVKWQSSSDVSQSKKQTKRQRIGQRKQQSISSEIYLPLLCRALTLIQKARKVKASEHTIGALVHILFGLNRFSNKHLDLRSTLLNKWWRL